jgi:hypothetical protein
VKVVLVHTITGQHPVMVKQSANGLFTVHYGKQVRSGLSYTEALTEYGACIFHALGCAGLLDHKHEPTDPC